METIAIFCSSREGLDPKYEKAAKELVEGLCKKGYGIVSGGSFCGTMGVVSDTAKACGGHHKGVLPEFLASYVYEGIDEMVWTPTMAARKEEIRSGTKAAIALPGGIGTLDELIETQVLIKLGQYKGRLILLNTDGFYAPFRALLDHYVSEHMLSPADRSIVEFFATPAELLATL